MSIEVIRPGALSSFQDLGRGGYQHLGVPANGAMDERAHRLANALVGNAPGEATLEITLTGPTLRFHRAAVIAVCGADLDAWLDEQPLPRERAVVAPVGSTLSFERRRSGVRAYLAVRGGFELAMPMGSASTALRAGYGGHRGRALRRGDTLTMRERYPSFRERPGYGEVFAPGVLRAAGEPLRVVAGREWARFTPHAQAALLNTVYRVSPQSDRMGYRLEGLPLSLLEPFEAASEALSCGTVQVPPDGQPIVLMADRQTTGGYPKIAQVCSVDLPRLAQTLPGESIAFERVELAEAQRLALAQARGFDTWERRDAH
ncbi:biotin-dependent carboxyltransferase family protein [Burkholderia gladioli]|uniref:5-oxoprolinase subunit C family protein n=1 Tax=Burkholderia gladioli TaxID=28095 RepID=UPI001641102F|nr:biotin-dependent carboxyltransferase family protein [Burkholderia gladioli]